MPSPVPGVKNTVGQTRELTAKVNMCRQAHEMWRGDPGCKSLSKGPSRPSPLTPEMSGLLYAKSILETAALGWH